MICCIYWDSYYIVDLRFSLSNLYGLLLLHQVLETVFVNVVCSLLVNFLNPDLVILIKVDMDRLSAYPCIQCIESLFMEFLCYHFM